MLLPRAQLRNPRASPLTNADTFPAQRRTRVTTSPHPLPLSPPRGRRLLASAPLMCPRRRLPLPHRRLAMPSAVRLRIAASADERETSSTKCQRPRLSPSTPSSPSDAASTLVVVGKISAAKALLVILANDGGEREGQRLGDVREDRLEGRGARRAKRAQLLQEVLTVRKEGRPETLRCGEDTESHGSACGADEGERNSWAGVLDKVRQDSQAGKPPARAKSRP